MDNPLMRMLHEATMNPSSRLSQPSTPSAPQKPASPADERPTTTNQLLASLTGSGAAAPAPPNPSQSPSNMVSPGGGVRQAQLLDLLKGPSGTPDPLTSPLA